MIKGLIVFGLLVTLVALGAAGADRTHMKAAVLSAFHYAQGYWREVAGAGDALGAKEIQGEAGLLMDEKTGKILFDKNENRRLYPASTTKIVTALVALEKAEPNERVTVGDEVDLRTADESTAGLKKGQKLSLRDLLSAMLLPSGNDAARTVARYIASKETGRSLSAEESIRYFASLMNDKAAQLGAVSSHFVNPHGLHDPQHYTTARDLAVIARAAMGVPEFRSIVSEAEHTVSSSSARLVLANRNKLLQAGSDYYMRGANGIKTGFTDEAGYCLVASASRGGRELIAVVLKSTESDVWLDSQKLLEYGFAGLPSGKRAAAAAGRGPEAVEAPSDKKEGVPG
ncbi:D-alanyl-D-alanine carboxypeptidase DacB precursor [Paenibacillus konkukensis]|uniref:D-alanyl-D-alanine carboxypeptidase DacB n=1 Tax=Paenibacillus konkukensis TaxID=2020716 RepID=A0ABY4RWW8_9BACL|nr:D-alanyl-D-alanine carboxypeptidase family protein [Paenibacillus konkukensis]UQZ86688.1 D-alanyl-D-alanine carboxypeptidase DacB precursor [Paenibacillus konkukensis]